MDQFKFFIKKLLWDIKGGYSPREFWEKWGKTFIDDSWQHKIFTQHKLLLDVIKKEKNPTILEVGMGFGRNIKYLSDRGIPEKNLTGIEISKSMIKNARKYLKTHKATLKQGDVLNLPFKDSSFDVVFVFSVLMHVKPEDINHAMQELLRVSKKNIVIIEQNYKPSKTENASWYTFIHAYGRILKEKSAKVKTYKKGANGYDFYHVVKSS